MLPWKQQKHQYKIYFSLAKFQLVSCNLSLAMIWQMTYTQKLLWKLCSATLNGLFWQGELHHAQGCLFLSLTCCAKTGLLRLMWKWGLKRLYICFLLQKKSRLQKSILWVQKIVTPSPPDRTKELISNRLSITDRCNGGCNKLIIVVLVIVITNRDFCIEAEGWWWFNLKMRH